MADTFMKKSGTNFLNYISYIDGVLAQTNKFSTKCLKGMSIGSTNF